MRRLKVLLSIRNLLMKRRTQPRGQIATFLLLILGGLLIIALATANLGKLSLATLKASNAVDSAALLLGSELATKANILIHTKGLDGQVENCKNTGMLPVVLSITMDPIIGGFIGGLIVEGDLNGAFAGALQGIQIGAAVGGGVIAGGIVTGGNPIGMAIGGAVALTSSVYNAYSQEQRSIDNFTEAVRRLRNLAERDSFREQVFLQALTQTVNDPNRTADAKNPNDTAACYWPTPDDPVGNVVIPGDPGDANANGNNTESIPCFEYWQDQRTTKLQQMLPQLRKDVQAFFDGPMSTFETAAEATYQVGGGSSCGDGTCDFDEQCGWVNVCEQDCGVCPSSSDGGGDDGGGSE
ncbi:MAG: hypothetical protein HYZ89_00260 [Candidatus Omnitrophica bacterium]|nr:hypothetical protein [Candidatus Omnitrophota bacterium]